MFIKIKNKSKEKKNPISGLYITKTGVLKSSIDELKRVKSCLTLIAFPLWKTLFILS